jgi:hypothetical protein
MSVFSRRRRENGVFDTTVTKPRDVVLRGLQPPRATEAGDRRHAASRPSAARAIMVPMSRERTIRGWSKAGMSMGERARANHITVIDDVARFRDADGRPQMAGTVGDAGQRTMFVRAVEDRMGVMRYGSPGKGAGEGRTVIILTTSGEPSHDREFDRRDDTDGVLRLAHRMREAHLADAIRVVDSLPIA